MDANFQKLLRLQDSFGIKSGTVGAYLGNNIVVESEHYKVSNDQSTYIQACDILDTFEIGNSHLVGTPITKRLSVAERGEELSPELRSAYRVKTGSLLYLACWTRQDIAFAVSELSCTHKQAVKRVLRYLGGTKNLGLRYTGPLVNS